MSEGVMRVRKLTVSKVEAALRANAGVILYTAVALSVTRKSLYEFMRKHPELEQVRDEARETMLDTAEHHVVNAVNSGDMRTVRWVLDRLGRHRGYSTRQEVAGVEHAPLTFERIEHVIVDPDPELVQP
jgi:hypothetical protein